MFRSRPFTAINSAATELRELHRVAFVQGYVMERPGQLARGGLFRTCEPQDTVSTGKE